MQKIYDRSTIQHIISQLPADDYEQLSPDNPEKFNRLGLNEQGGYGFTLPKSNPDNYELIKDFNRDLRIQGSDIGQWAPNLKTASLLPETTDPKYKTKLLNHVIAMVLFPNQHLNQHHLEMTKPQMQALLRAYNQTVSASVFNALFARAFNTFNLLFFDENTNSYFVEYICAIIQPTAVRNLIYNATNNSWELHYQATIEFRIRDSTKPTRDKLQSELVIDELATFAYDTIPVPHVPSPQYSLVPEQQNGFILQKMAIIDQGIDPNQIGFAGLFDAFLGWKQSEQPNIHTHLTSQFNDKLSLSPELSELLLMPIIQYAQTLPATAREQVSSISKLQHIIRNPSPANLAFPEIIALNREPLCKHFDVLKPLLAPMLAENLTIPRTTHTLLQPSWAQRNIPGITSGGPPNQLPTYSYGEARIRNFIAQITTDKSNDVYKVCANGGYGSDHKNEGCLLRDCHRTVMLEGKKIQDWSRDKTIVATIEDIDEPTTEQIKPLVLEIIEKKALQKQPTKVKPIKVTAHPPDYSKLAAVHFKILTSIYTQNISRLPYLISEHMLTNELALPYILQIQKTPPATINLSYDPENGQWVCASKMTCRLFPGPPTEDETCHKLADITFTTNTYFKIPGITVPISDKPDLVVPLLDSKGFQVSEMQIQAPKQFLDWFALYFYMTTSQTKGARDEFLNYSMHILNQLGYR